MAQALPSVSFGEGLNGFIGANLYLQAGNNFQYGTSSFQFQGINYGASYLTNNGEI